VRQLGRGVYRCTMCNEIVRTHSDTLPLIAFTGDGERTERSITVLGIEVHRCRISDGTPVDVVARRSTAWTERAL